MTKYPMQCPVCGGIIDSHDSLADTKAELREHIKNHHLEAVTNYPETLNKVRAVLSEAGMINKSVEDVIGELLDAGILFRERIPYGE